MVGCHRGFCHLWSDYARVDSQPNHHIQWHPLVLYPLHTGIVYINILYIYIYCIYSQGSVDQPPTLQLTPAIISTLSSPTAHTRPWASSPSTSPTSSSSLRSYSLALRDSLRRFSRQTFRLRDSTHFCLPLKRLT